MRYLEVEYKVVEQPYSITQKELNAYGQEGWEMTSCMAVLADRAHPRTYYYYFRRRENLGV